MLNLSIWSYLIGISIALALFAHGSAYGQLSSDRTPQLTAVRMPGNIEVEVSWQNLPERDGLVLMTSAGNRYFQPQRINAGSGKMSISPGDGITGVVVARFKDLSKIDAFPSQGIEQSDVSWIDIEVVNADIAEGIVNAPDGGNVNIPDTHWWQGIDLIGQYAMPLLVAITIGTVGFVLKKIRKSRVRKGTRQ